MATSQNGWPVYTTGTHKNLVAIPKIAGRVRKGSVATIFKDLVSEFDRTVEDVDTGKDEWGYAYRPVRGQSRGYSNHASGTAIDINAMQHPRGARGTFSASEVRAIKRILSRYEGVIRWGGDYTIGKKDEMHFEVDASASRVNAVAKKLSAGNVVPTAPAKPKPIPHTQPTDVVWTGLSVSDTKTVQGYLKYTGDYNGILDGEYGQMTKSAVLRYQKRQHANGMMKHLKADGLWGPLQQNYFDWVKKLQKNTGKWTASQRLGSLPEDGDYGSKTKKHVKAVQAANGKRPNGAYWKNGGRVADGIAGSIYAKTIGIPAKP